MRHSNPGPGVRRGRREGVEDSRRRWYERRYARRKESYMGKSRAARAVKTDTSENECVIVTWNDQGVSFRQKNGNHVKRIADKVVRKGWEVVFLLELVLNARGWCG